MNSDSNPYQSPVNSPQMMRRPPMLPFQGEVRPARILVFGIVHLVLAAYGLLTLVWILLQPMFMDFLASQNPELRRQMVAQSGLQSNILWAGILAGVLAILLLVAGIKMLKRHRNALGWSTAYSLASIGSKIVMIPINLLFFLPAMREAYRVNHVAVPGFILSWWYFLGAALIGMVYPIIALVMLRRPMVRDWFSKGS